MLLPLKKTDTGEEPEDPRAELVRRLLEYEQMKLAAQKLDALPQLGRDFKSAQAVADISTERMLPDVSVDDLRAAWADILKRAKLNQHHHITREQLSVRHQDRKSVVSGKSVSVRVDLGGHRISKKKNKN